MFCYRLQLKKKETLLGCLEPRSAIMVEGWGARDLVTFVATTFNFSSRCMVPVSCHRLME
jgi:hypothetical protein